MGPNSQQAHDVVTTPMRRRYVASTSFRRHVPTRFLINQCLIITFLILKFDIIENSRIELRGIVLPAPSNQIKLHLLLYYPLTWYICDFFLFHIETEGKGGWIIGGWGGGQRVCWPHSQTIGGPGPPAPPPSSYAHGQRLSCNSSLFLGNGLQGYSRFLSYLRIPLGSPDHAGAIYQDET